MPFLPAIIVFAVVFLSFSKEVLGTTKSSPDSYREKFISDEPNNRTILRKKVNKIAISELFIADKYRKARTISIIYGCFISILYLIGSDFINHSIYVSILVTPIIMLFTQAILIEYRLKRGFYACNEYEARELIEFIEINSESFDDDNGTSKKVFADIELSDDSIENWGLSQEGELI